MISPASGIHRPSYNGAPATQTVTSYKWLPLPFTFATRFAFNVCERVCRTAQKRVDKARLGQDRDNKFFALVIRVAMFGMTVMRRMRNLTQI